MKKFGFLALLLLLLVLVHPGTGYAGSAETHINLDGNDLKISKEAQVQIVNGSVMVPLRVVAEQLGYTVKWDNVTKTAIIEQKGTTLKLIVDNTMAEASGKQVKLDNPPFLSGSTTLVPLRFVGEQTGTTVGWDNVTKTVYLTSPVPEIGGSDPEITVPQPTPTAPSDNGSNGNTATEGNSSVATVTNLSFIDNQLVIAVNGSIKPTVFTMTDKDRIVVDLPNTGFGTDFHQNLSVGKNQSGQLTVTDYPNVSAVRYSLFSSSPSTIRIVIDLNSANSYSLINANDGLIIVDLNGTSVTLPETTLPEVPVITPPPSTGNTDKKIIVIDAGHGGKDPGSSSVNKLKEKDFTLPTALKIAELLKKEPNIEVILTRSGDTYPTLQDRSNLANNVKADLFISVHANSIPAGSKSNPSGTETYYTRNDSLLFAQTVHKYLAVATGLQDRGVRQANYHVTRETKMPAILLECGYLSNTKDEALLFTPDIQNKIAEAVVLGIKEYLGR
ncbi:MULTISPECIES: N-acetylmuramoyl-L-alanine amidase family protein [unclassified Paenibacillus]|jgi:N-acetylmuramoyl-L-alanine amidase|uniref:N-acetylmuramoyl-L-alanine amidase family protein n=1 Tax=unclassified Paenibacillus TaxID=185978 RepID=UPI0024747336|nr:MULTISPECIES: N-acetylmuramoyl-L-alanine amidase family protein [unclassified Paenibacillus]MDH6444756.1 N-acetylmuramoyl-L-alanine amidase [Paenibacillus sp. PastF-4]